MIKNLENDFALVMDEIFYCDDELKMTSISGVDESVLESCIKTILETNPNINFRTIQYSKTNRRVYFYTDKSISTTKWLGAKKSSTNVLASATDVLEEIKKVLLDERKQENTCMSIYDSDNIIPLYEVVDIVRQKQNGYQKIKDSYSEKIKSAYRTKAEEQVGLYIRDFDYDKMELEISFARYYLGNYTDCFFKKQDNDLTARTTIGYRDVTELLLPAGNIISEAYDKFLEYKAFKNQESCHLRPLNSNFLIDINCYGIKIYTNTTPCFNIFSLESKNYSIGYRYECNSNNIIEVLKGKEDELYKKIFVRIDECPEWMHGILYEKRQKMLDKKKKEEIISHQQLEFQKQKMEKQETKKQKRIEFRRKYLPFLEKKIKD